ncbi:MAG: single-stranded DNA-binding protein [Betaproteobacteria bacterium]
MPAINLFVIDGNVTRDPELRYTTKGTPTTTYVVAVDRVFVDADQQKHEEADFLPVTTYGRQAENDAKYLKRGAAVTVKGQIRSWYDPQAKRGGLRLEAETVVYQGRPGRAAAAMPKAPDDDWLRQYDATVAQQSRPGKD